MLRIFFGITLFANGLAKYDSDLGRIDIGACDANLITRTGARGIINFEVNNRQIRKHAPKGTDVLGLRRLSNNLILKR